MLWVELHDKDGRVSVADLTEEGKQQAIYMCEQLIEELKDLEVVDDDD